MPRDAIVTYDDVERASALLDGVVHRTPVMISSTIDGLVGASVWCKCEQLQRGGAFKIRGAFTRVSAAASAGAHGVAAISSGNHAQAVAIAARQLGLPAVVLMPEDAPAVKLDATRGYGAEVVTYDRYGADRDRLGRELARERGFEMVHPYDDPLVMAGQGTVAMELLDEVPDLDALVAPIGGGGLIAGCATAARHRRASIRVIGVEPAVANDMQRSVRAGVLTRTPARPTIADGQQAQAGASTFEVVRRLVDEILTVDDDDIRRAMRLLVTRMKLVVEPSGASALAGLLRHGDTLGLRGARIGVVLSGGNVGPDRLAALIG